MKKRRCKRPTCKGTPKVQCEKCKVFLECLHQTFSKEFHEGIIAADFERLEISGFPLILSDFKRISLSVNIQHLSFFSIVYNSFVKIKLMKIKVDLPHCWNTLHEWTIPRDHCCPEATYQKQATIKSKQIILVVSMIPESPKNAKNKQEFFILKKHKSDNIRFQIMQVEPIRLLRS